MRLIDADALMDSIQKQRWDYQMLDDTKTADKIMHGLYQAEQIINVAPTIDAVPVVRCRECKHSELWYWDRSRCFLWVEDGISVFNDGFCSYGERKDGDA